MTILSDNNITLNDELLELFIKNSPARFRAGNEKHLANIKTYPAKVALEKCKFININAKEQISFMVFDIDSYEGMTAREYFKNINGFLAYIIEKIEIYPTYILRTDKGFHFAYHLQNHVFTDKLKSVDYLVAIKKEIGKRLGCDEIASNRLYGVWRNPLLHDFYYMGHINYELKDFKHLLPEREKRINSSAPKIKVDKSLLKAGNRNNQLFRYAMKYAKGQTSLSVQHIYDFLVRTNEQSEQPLPDKELHSIASSVYKYWEEGKILFGTLCNKEKNINEGIMEFPKITVYMEPDEYQQEVRRRRQLSAERTNKIKDKEKAKRQLTQAREQSAQKRKAKNEEKIFQAITQLQQEGLKVTVSAISRIAGIDRRTVKKLPISLLPVCPHLYCKISNHAP